MCEKIKIIFFSILTCKFLKSHYLTAPYQMMEDAEICCGVEQR